MVGFPTGGSKLELAFTGSFQSWKWTKSDFLTSDEQISYNGHKQISEYIWMPHYVPNKYPNIFKCSIFTEQISEYICTLEIA